MACQMIELEVHVAWWLQPYIYALAAFSEITGLDADTEKLQRVIERAITVRPKR